MRLARGLLPIVLAVLSAACDPAPGDLGSSPATGPTSSIARSPDPPAVGECPPPPRPSPPSVLVYFGCTADGGEPNVVHGLPRAVTPGTDPLRAAFEHLLEGPTEKESARGYVSAFSDRTAGLLLGAETQGSVATIDFGDLREPLPAVSETTERAMLLSSLYSTAFQFAEVDTLLMTIDGSCEAFWIDWLDGDACQEVTRSFWESTTTVR